MAETVTATTGRSRRNKGHAWERAVAAWLRGIWPDARRRTTGLARDDIEAVPISVECKDCDTLAIPAWVRQAEQQADGRPWMIVAHRRGHPSPDGAHIIIPGWFAAELLTTWKDRDR